MTDTTLVVDGSNIATEGRTAPNLQQLDEAVPRLHRRAPPRSRDRRGRTRPSDIGSTPRRSLASKRPSSTATWSRLRPGPSDEATHSSCRFADRSNRQRVLQRFVPGVPRHLRLAVRQRPAGRRQARTSDRLGVRRTDSRCAGRPAVAPSASPNNGLSPARPPAAQVLHRDAVVTRRPVPPATEARVRAHRRRGSRSKRTAEVDEAPTVSGVELGPMPVPKTPPPAPASRQRTKSPSRPAVNEPLPFLQFVTEYPIGGTVTGEVVEFSSHGAYVTVGQARCYVPLKALGSPAPTECTRCAHPGRGAFLRRGVVRYRTPRHRPVTPRDCRGCLCAGVRRVPRFGPRRQHRTSSLQPFRGWLVVERSTNT